MSVITVLKVDSIGAGAALLGICLLSLCGWQSHTQRWCLRATPGLMLAVASGGTRAHVLLIDTTPGAPATCRAYAHVL